MYQETEIPDGQRVEASKIKSTPRCTNQILLLTKLKKY